MIRMIRISLLFLSFLASMMPFAAQAQERGEISVFGGFSEAGDFFHSGSGWNVSISGNVMKHVALVADISGHYSGGSTGWFGSPPNHKYSFLFGPRYVHTFGQRWTPFAHALFGAYRETRQPGEPGSNSKNMAAFSFGGGLDIRITDWFSVRVSQIDAVIARENGSRHDYARFSAGAVFHLKGASR
jgi:hypothetical protein